MILSKLKYYITAGNTFTEAQKLDLFNKVAPSLVKLVIYSGGLLFEGTGFAVYNHSSGETLFATANHAGKCNETTVKARHIFVNTSDYFPSLRSNQFKNMYQYPGKNVRYPVSVAFFEAEQDLCFLRFASAVHLPYVPP